MHYFKTQSPLSKLYLSGGRVVKWVTFDGVVGWFSTDDPVVVTQLLGFASRKIGGGISEVSQAEYEGALGKAKGRRYEPDREWVDLHGPRSARPPSEPPAAEGSEAPAPVPQAEPPKPTVRRRAKT